MVFALVAVAPADAAVWASPIPVEGVPFSGPGQIAATDEGEVVSVITQYTGESRLDWLSADGTLQAPQSRGGVLGSAADGTMFLLSRTDAVVSLATKPPGLPFGPDVPIADGPGGSLMDVNGAGDIALAFGDDLGLLRRGAASVERIEVPLTQYSRFSDIELTDAGEILAARVSASGREVVIVPPSGNPRVERLADGGCDLQIASGPDGRAVAAWSPPATEYSCDGSQNLAALRPAGGSFGAAAEVPGMPWQSKPRIAVGSSGRAVLAYDSSYPNGVTPYVVLLTAGPADTTWTTSATFLGYTDGIVSTPAGVWLAYGTGYIGPHTARVSEAGKPEDVQDVVADCMMGSTAFTAAPSGRGAMLGWRYGPQQYALLRQVAGAAPTSQCGRPSDPPPEAPTPDWPGQPLPSPPITKPLPKPATAVTLTVKSSSRRRVLVRFKRSNAGKLTTSGTLRVPGQKAINAIASGSTVVTLTFRVPARTWRALARKRGRLTLKASSPEGGRWDFRRTLKR